MTTRSAGLSRYHARTVSALAAAGKGNDDVPVVRFCREPWLTPYTDENAKNAG